MRWLVVVLAAACRYDATFDDCQVSACRGEDECPSGFDCDEQGFCRAPGATASCAAVLDAADQPLPDAEVPGDDAPDGEGSCTGTPTGCAAFTSSTSCLDQAGCGWTTPSCTVTTDCGAIETNQECMEHDECFTNFETIACEPVPGYCTGATEAACEDDPVCAFSGGCTGAATGCAGLDEPACEAQHGCAWE
jgi:hypothetical protein